MNLEPTAQTGSVNLDIMQTIGTDTNAQSAIDIIENHVFFRPTPGQGWMSKPELPTVDEILARQSDIEQLPENPVDAPWASKGEYLAAQYGILRCEATEGLRYSVRSFADYGRKEPMMDDDFTNIYTKVRVTQYVMSSIGPLARVSFSTERSLYKIQWQQSKRLQPGKIVALSPKDDNFKTVCKIATVAQRPYRDGLDQDPPVVDLLWARPEDAVFDPSLEMVMIESLHGYFESARHALVGLQLAAQTDSPLDKYLTGAYTKDTYPRFLKEDPIMDLSSLASRATEADSEVVTELKTHDIVNGKIPVLKDLTFLDDSQLLALSRIISQELAIVQGPPGTGKTFTSVEAIKIMVANRRRHRGPPIVVAAQTNHALDQILVHCIKAGANVIRMGGRTQNELIKPRTLFELRQRAQIPADRKCNSIDHQRRENVRKIQELVDTLFGDSLLDPDALLRFGIITEAQHQSLCDESMEAHPALEAHGPFALWLGDSLIPAKIREDRHPTQLEVTEAEARKNLPEFEYEDDEEIENIADDEEDLVRFRGPVITLKYVWSGKDPANLSSWGRAVKRALRNDDLFAIEKNLRGAVYQYFQSRLLEAMTPEFAALLAENVVLCKKRKAFKFLGNTQLVEQQRIDIVGCTTTGLTKYRGCIAAMQPQSLLIEEAAETREANIVSALYPSVQQLILVGDHKQLAPKCDIQRLGDAPYNLNVSLFQRMVNLNMSFVMLQQQRRMKPELRAILNPFYPELVDHPSVESGENRPDVPGMGGRNSWIFHHNWPEDVNSDFSKLNEQEAEMIVHFFAYLVSNGTPAEKITVLTFYKGQRKVLLRKLKRHPSLMGALFNVCTVDSYQGEENDVVLLSMVRSPQKGRFYAVGFLEDERRAVVAISRARRGFYVFGNVDNVLQAHQLSHDLWHKICSGFVAQGRADWLRGLPLVCQSHGEETWIQKVDDWGDNCGGCNRLCKQTRPCGHPCTLKCHAAFENMARQAEAAAQQHMSLEQKILQMGAEPTEMLMASLNRRNASRQQEQGAPTPPVQRVAAKAGQPSGRGQTIASSDSSRRTASRGQRGGQYTYARAAQMAAQWGHLVDNIGQHDEQLRQERLASAEHQGGSLEMIIRDVYQPTALVEGLRVGNGDTLIKQILLTSAEATRAAAISRQENEGELIPGLTDLAISNLSPSPPEEGSPTSSNITNKDSYQSSATGPNTPRVSNTNSARKSPHTSINSAAIPPSHPALVQQQQPPPPLLEGVNPPAAALESLLIDDPTATMLDLDYVNSENTGLQAGHETNPYLLAQIGAAPARPQAQELTAGVPEQQQANGTGTSSGAGGDGDDDEWLIEL